MISPISIATRGRISTSTKKTLTLAVIGWLVFTSDDSIGGSNTQGRASGGSNFKLKQKEQESKQFKKLLLREDEEILLIIKMYTEQCLL